MGSCFVKQVQSFFKFTETKHYGGDKLLIGFNDGSLQEFSMIENKTIYHHDKILDNYISSLHKTLNNKS